MNRILKFQKPSRSEWTILVILGGIVIIALLWWSAIVFIDSQKTYPLGNKLEYIGKESTTCHIGSTPVGFDFGNCNKIVFYYYATNMNMADTIAYFRNAKPEEAGGYDVGTTGTEGLVWSHVQNVAWQSQPMQFGKGEIAWFFYYYSDGQSVARALSRTTSKAHVIRINAADYPSIFKYAL
jgi:hypothetical protein